MNKSYTGNTEAIIEGGVLQSHGIWRALQERVSLTGFLLEIENRYEFSHGP